MSVTSRSPLRFAGAVTNSGNVNTGEQNLTLGGAQAATIYSGMASGTGLIAAPLAVLVGQDVLFFSGAGRLKDVFIHTANLLSGPRIQFYDSIQIGSGVVAASGPKILANIQVPIFSGVITAGSYFAFDVPFQSGLACSLGATSGSASGFPGFTVTYSPETNLPNPG